MVKEDTIMTETGKKPEMKWEHAPDALVQTFMDTVKFLPGIQVRKMFGYPCAFSEQHVPQVIGGRPG
jgi:hypothetical protein